jgi:hypothetical protein
MVNEELENEIKKLKQAKTEIQIELIKEILQERKTRPYIVQNLKARLKKLREQQ